MGWDGMGRDGEAVPCARPASPPHEPAAEQDPAAQPDAGPQGTCEPWEALAEAGDHPKISPCASAATTQRNGSGKATPTPTQN